MKKKYKISLAALLLAASVLFSGCGTSSAPYTVNLEVWGLYDDSSTFTEIINQYKKINPHVGEIKYRKFTADTYRADVLEALASGQGPDIFLVHNSWVPSFKNKLEPAPKEITNLQELASNFPDAVASDFADNGSIYGYPSSVDSLALYYNKDMLSAVGISRAPETWDEFNEAARRMTAISGEGNILRAGAAMGTARNINRSTDILTMLMMQNGVEMTDKSRTSVTFDRGTLDASGNPVPGGANALAYYTSFARLTTDGNKPNPLYTWNPRMADSVEAFAEGKAGMMINYSWQMENIKNANPKLNYAVAPLPQMRADKPASYANYWAWTVSKNKLQAQASAGQQQAAVPNAVRVFEAWEFLRFLTVNNKGTVHLTNAISKNSADFSIGSFDPAAEYLKKTGKPAARRDLIEAQKTDPALAPFALGNLIAKTWYQADSDQTEGILSEAIDSVNRGSSSPSEALSLAATRIKNIMQAKSVGR